MKPAMPWTFGILANGIHDVVCAAFRTRQRLTEVGFEHLLRDCAADFQIVVDGHLILGRIDDSQIIMIHSSLG